jgi:hypothetical protein
MGICSTYAELQSEIASLHHRDPGNITTFIHLAEKRINQDLESRLAEVDGTLTATVSSRYIALPSGYMSTYGLWMTYYNPRKEIIYLSPEQLRTDTSNGQPKYYTVDGSNLAFDCPADIAYTYTLRYKKGYDIATTLTNDVLTNNPGLYLYGSLMIASVNARDKEATRDWAELYNDAMEQAKNSENKNKQYIAIQSDAALLGGIQRSNISSGDY